MSGKTIKAVMTYAQADALVKATIKKALVKYAPKGVKMDEKAMKRASMMKEAMIEAELKGQKKCAAGALVALTNHIKEHAVK